MKLGKQYPITMDVNRRDIEFDDRAENHDQHGDYNLEIVLRDEACRRKFATVTIPAGRLMAALGNRSHVPCTIEFEDAFRLFGKSRETKTVWIKEQKKLGADKKPKIPAKLEAEGWAYYDGYGSSRSGEVREGIWHYPCTLQRFVDEDTEE